MEKQQELTYVIQSICEKVLKGELLLESFYNIWPKKAENNTFFELIFEDIENGIEHTPGKLYSREVNQVVWQKTDMYLTIYLDYTLLSVNRPLEDLIQCRLYILKQQELSKEIIKNMVKEYFNTNKIV